MDIGSGSEYPIGELSNFTENHFVVDGIEIKSMEGFLQSLKFSSKVKQKEICKLIGYDAKKAGRNQNWQKNQVLYWNGNDYRRDGIEYQLLLNKAYECMYRDSEGFRNALKASGTAILTHSIGRTNMMETILTENEFCSRLMKLRDNDGKLNN